MSILDEMRFAEDRARAAEDAKTPEYQWLTTQSHPRLIHSGAPSSISGWKTHAVKSTPAETFTDMRWRRAACGLLPAHGWGMDLFIEQRCKRCDRAVRKEQT